MHRRTALIGGGLTLGLLPPSLSACTRGLELEGWGSSFIKNLSVELEASVGTLGYAYVDQGVKGELLDATIDRMTRHPARTNSFALFNLGKNDLQRGTSGERVAQQSIEGITAVKGKYRDFLVLGHFVNSGTPTAAGVRKRIADANVILREHFGPRYTDIGAYLTDPKIWLALKVQPTPADLDDQARGEKPWRLSSDSGHLNTDGNRLIAAYITRKVHSSFTP